MKRIMMLWVLSLTGVLACVQAQDAAPVPADEERTSIAAAPAQEPPALEPAAADRKGEGSLICCADWTCPTTGAEYTGCTHATPTQTQARAQCNAACNVPCTSPGSYCN